MKTLLSRLVVDEDGQDLIEYALLAALIALACTAAMTYLADGIQALFSKVADKLDDAVPD